MEPSHEAARLLLRKWTVPTMCVCSEYVIYMLVRRKQHNWEKNRILPRVYFISIELQKRPRVGKRREILVPLDENSIRTST
jgi:hypothetical protein